MEEAVRLAESRLLLTAGCGGPQIVTASADLRAILASGEDLRGAGGGLNGPMRGVPRRNSSTLSVMIKRDRSPLLTFGNQTGRGQKRRINWCAYSRNTFKIYSQANQLI
ncbi:hypothetical protein HPP92_005573 [Vanilla planifolia]|uniref:Uncharacterized protein n=1 Tax=Vanilla planifolia TaxID=51239 RepID=A0A835VCR1_VANPL|nr:hypothetical protein HPP92_005573 [Vanilla planifolia]